MASPRPSGPVDASLRFDPDRTDLPGSVRTDLRRVVDDLKRNPGARLKIEGYSAVADESGNKARRDSLSRALAVRRFLIEEGIVSTRMDVHALGSRTPEGTPADRVDVTIVRR
jgi:outer membrane protein OmpA-like peptidoglycan-associated protein